MTLTPSQFIRNFGPPNCWSGTVGTACCHIRDLLRENDCLHAHIDELTKELSALREDAERIKVLQER